MNKKNIDELRYHSRDLVRELGFLENPYERYGLNFAHVHLLLECERYGSIDQQTLAKNLRVNKSYISRLVKSLMASDLISPFNNALDNRSKPVMLTPSGQMRVNEINVIANTQVRSACDYLTNNEQRKIKEGLQLYAQALKKSRQLNGVNIRYIEEKDNASMSALIKMVLIEHGANRPGFAFTDPETNALYEAYQGSGKRYFVAEKSNRLLGGIGFGALDGAESSICELRKMYVVKEARGIGLGDELLRLAVSEATQHYKTMYLETLSSMTQAISLYRRHDFEFLPEPIGNTGHFSCDTWMKKELA